MNQPFPPVELRFGDALLYYTKGDLVDWLIRTKTGMFPAHIENYIGNNRSVASRNGIGVNTYALRQAGLVAVLRPKIQPMNHINQEIAMGWFFSKACGQKYDFKGLLAFWFAKWKADPGRMFCSEFSTNWYRAGGFEPFSPDLDADHVAPGTFLVSGEFDHIWKNF